MNSTGIAVLLTPEPWATTSGHSGCGRGGSVASSVGESEKESDRRRNFAADPAIVR
jgi:hypothetical protein